MQTPPRALDGVRVLDLSHRIAGAYCAKLLAGYGAEVIQIETPGSGSPLRHQTPFCGNHRGLERSIAHLWFDTGKKSVTLDLTNPDSRDQLAALVARTDVVVETFAPGHLASFDLGFEHLRQWNPGLVLASITDFGQNGPYRHYQAEEIVTYALSGQMFGTGDPTHPPLAPGPPISQMTAGLHAYAAILMALKMREEGSPEARQIDVSVHEAGLENMEMKAMPFFRAGLSPSRAELARPPVVPWGVYPCKDGHAAILGAPFRRWRYFARLFPEGALLEKIYEAGLKKMENARSRNSSRAGTLGSALSEKLKSAFLHRIHRLTRRWAATRTREEIVREGIGRGLAFAALPSLKEVLDSPQHRSRHFFEKIEHPETGPRSYCGAPFSLQRTPWQTTRAPLLGEHTDAVLNSLNITHIAPTRAEGAPTPGDSASISPSLPSRLPLSGIRVLDLTHVEAGPHATRILADYGAEVIRIENLSRLCVFRGVCRAGKAYDRQPLWSQLNRNKRSLTLNLKSEKERTLFFELVRQADVVIENFRSGVMSRLGLGYGKLRALRPDLIMVSMSAFGASGPLATFPGYGGSIEAMSGLQNLTAIGPQGKPERIREMDVLNGVAGVCALMTALIHRAHTGQGQHIDLSQMEVTTHALMGESLLEFAQNESQSLPTGNRHPAFAPQGCYPCRGEDKWLALTVRTEAEWRALCEVLQQPQWAQDPRFQDAPARAKNHDTLDTLIGAWTRDQDHEKAMNLLQHAAVPAGAVLNLREILLDPHVRARGWFQGDVNNPGNLLMGMPFRISGIHPPSPVPGPALGRDNAWVLGALLHRSEGDLEPPDEASIGTAFRLDPFKPLKA